MAATKPSTRDAIVAAAVELFYERGYDRTSLAQIAKHAEVNPGSLYYFFKTKQSLLLAVLDWYLVNLQPVIVEPVFARETDPVERIFGILDGYRLMLEMTHFNGGCPIGNLAVEVSAAMPEATAKIAENFDQWKKVIAECLQEAAGGLPSAERTRLADLVLTTMEGAVMQARAYKSIEPFDAAIAALRDYLERVVGSAPEP